MVAHLMLGLSEPTVTESIFMIYEQEIKILEFQKWSWFQENSKDTIRLKKYKIMIKSILIA